MRPKIGSHAANLNRETCSPGFVGEWEVRRLGDHVTFLRNGVNSRAELTLDDPVKYLHYGDIHSCTSVMLDPASLPSLPSGEAKNLDRLRDGDLVFADASEDLVGVSKSVEICSVSSTEIVSGLHTIAARFDKNTLADGFKAYLQFCPVFSGQLRRLAAGTKVYATNRSHIASVEMRLPGVKEQEAIVSVLSDTDALLDGLDWLIAKKRDLKQAAMQQLLTGKTRLPGFEGEWEVKTLGEIATTIKDGTHQTPKYVASGVPFYSVEHVTSGDFSNTKFISIEEHRFLSQSFKIEKGDILMTRIGSIGNCKLIDWEVEASFYVSLALLKIRSDASSAFIAHYSNSRAFKEEVQLHSLPSAVPKKINLGPISNVAIKIPPTLEEQVAIAIVLTDMDTEISAFEQRRDKTKDIKQAMMQELLTGKTRLVTPGESNA